LVEIVIVALSELSTDPLPRSSFAGETLKGSSAT
jgi:hypothetical protein